MTVSGATAWPAPSSSLNAIGTECLLPGVCGQLKQQPRRDFGRGPQGTKLSLHSLQLNDDIAKQNCHCNTHLTDMK